MMTFATEQIDVAFLVHWVPGINPGMTWEDSGEQ
jgi:hypothetical protein